MEESLKTAQEALKLHQEIVAQINTKFLEATDAATKAAILSNIAAQ